jgi:PRTRC genetic system protein B
MTRGLGSELSATFLPGNVVIYSTQLTAWWEPPQIRSMFFARDCDGKTLDGKLFPHPALLFAVHNGHLMVWALAEEKRPEPDTWLHMAPYWNTYDDGRVCHGTMQTPQTVTVENLPQWSHAFFASQFTGSNLGVQQCSHPQGFLGMWASLAGAKRFPSEYLLRKGCLEATLCRSL